MGGKIHPSGGLESEILLRGDFFYLVQGTWGEVILTIRTFFKAKDSFLWILNINKIKINITCVSKEYEIKTKMVQEQ